MIEQDAELKAKEAEQAEKLASNSRPSSTASFTVPSAMQPLRKGSMAAALSPPSASSSRPGTHDRPGSRGGGPHPPQGSGKLLSSLGGGGGTHHHHAAGLRLLMYLRLLQERRVLPQMLPPSDVEEIFRRVYFLTGGTSVTIEDLTYTQFVDATCMAAMALYDQPKYHGQYQTLEAKLEAFFSIMCGLPVPRAAPLPLSVEQVVSGRVS